MDLPTAAGFTLAEHDFGGALERGELFLRYQPKIDLRSGRVVGVEALLRWSHPGRGLVSPAEFIPIAERTGDIVEIGRWVLREACAQAASWAASGLRLHMSVNLSARQLAHPSLAADVASVLDDTGLDPASLELEITESYLAQDVEVALEATQKLAALGVRLSIDDFGTGYSAMSSLQRFPIQVLKVDKSFIDNIVDSGEEAALARTIIRLGHLLGHDVVAEGVETVEQARLLQSWGCDVAQGFYFATPLASGDAEELALNTEALLEPPAPALLDQAPMDLLTLIQRSLQTMTALVGLEHGVVVRLDGRAPAVVASVEPGGGANLARGATVLLGRTGASEGESVAKKVGAACFPASAGFRTWISFSVSLRDGRSGVVVLASRWKRIVDAESMQCANVLVRVVSDAFNGRLERDAAHERALLAEHELRRRTEFVAMAEHKLKTPLTVIAAWVEEVDNWGELDAEDQGRAGAVLRSHVDRLRHHVDALLKEARTGAFSADMEIADVAVDDLLSRVAADFSTVSPAHTVGASVVPGARVRADADLAYQVFAHLVENALRHTEGGSVELGAFAEEDFVLLFVRDHGPGVPSGLDVFAPFERSAEARRSTPGAGVGLYLVRELVEAMGGTVTAGNHPEGGAIFTVVLPAAVPTSGLSSH